MSITGEKRSKVMELRISTQQKNWEQLSKDNERMTAMNIFLSWEYDTSEA